MEIGKEFVGLPIEALIGAPLDAANKAQMQLGKTTIEFIKTLAYKDGQGGDTLTLPLSFQRPIVDTNGDSKLMAVEIAPPLLGLVPIPALLVEDVTIDFEMEVKSAIKQTDITDATVKADAKGGFWGASYSINGSVTTKRENTRSTDKSAKYTVHVAARQQQPPEGLAKLIQALAGATEPYKVARGG